MGGLDVPANFGDEFGAAGPLHVGGGVFQPTHIVLDETVSLHGVHRLSFR
jgi:hypothetical protein